MDSWTKLRYQGFISTPPLWEGVTVSPFKQIDLPRDAEFVADATNFKNQRLGKLVEEFAFHQLKNQESISWICDNLQIQQEKRTVGELDALYYSDGIPVHLEVAYKFYLLDTIGTYNEPLAYWIGPSRKDSLFYKLDKLHNKQFPLLHSELTRPYLEAHQLDISSLRQQLCFKAQLFLPYGNSNFDVGPLNKVCVAGFYLSYLKMQEFRNSKFFVPEKLDWLVTPHHDVKWIDFSSAVEIIEPYMMEKRSPLVWMKNNDGVLHKCFVVFW